jgi:hypothetical protein
LLIFLITAIFFWFPKNYNKFISLSERTQSSEYLENYQSYKQILNFLEKLPKENKTFSITYDPSLFLFPESPIYDINLFWGFLVDWNKDVDIIILNKNHTPNAEYVPTINTLDYKSYMIEKEQYKSLVHDSPSCKSHSICFREVLTLSNKGVILLRN